MFQKIVPFLCCVALVYGGPPLLPLAVGLHGGQSVQTRNQDDLGNFNFGYDIVDEFGSANGRQEKGDAYGNRVGSYTIRDADGRVRRVDYVADAYGFRATIGTNEPGTATSEAANAAYFSTGGPVVVPPLAAAPAVLAPAVAHAPLLAPAPVLAPSPYVAPLASAPYLATAPAPIYRSYSAPLPLLSTYGPALRAYGHY